MYAEDDQWISGRFTISEEPVITAHKLKLPLFRKTHYKYVFLEEGYFYIITILVNPYRFLLYNIFLLTTVRTMAITNTIITSPTTGSSLNNFTAP